MSFKIFGAKGRSFMKLQQVMCH